MDHSILFVLSCIIVTASSWSVPHRRPQGAPHRLTRFAPSPARHYRIPSPVFEAEPTETHAQRPKREYDDHRHDSDHGHDHEFGRDHDHKGITGPVHTFIKTDKNANYKWGVRHHVGNKFAS